MADTLADKQAEADRLRGELSSLRIQREHGLQAGQVKAQEDQLDVELDRLRAEVERERAQLANDGTVDSAIAAMNSAASESPVLVSDLPGAEPAVVSGDADEKPIEEQSTPAASEEK